MQMQTALYPASPIIDGNTNRFLHSDGVTGDSISQGSLGVHGAVANIVGDLESRQRGLISRLFTERPLMKESFSRPQGWLTLAVITAYLLMTVLSGQAQKFMNPYAVGECTREAYQKFYDMNGIALTFLNPTTKKTNPPGAEYMVTWADPNSPYFYRSDTAIKGSLSSRSNGSKGHVEVIKEILYKSGKISGYVVYEANWPTGTGPKTTTLTAAEMSKRGNSSVYTLIGFLNPNFAPQVKNLKMVKTGSTSCRITFTPEDTDGKKLSLLGSITDSKGKVMGSASKEVDANKSNEFNVTKFTRGQSYRFYVVAWDFKGLKSSTNYVSFTW